MLYKNSKPSYLRFIKTTAKVLFVTEAVLFAGSYGIWHRMNTNQEFRKYMSINYPVILEGFYKVGETFDSTSKIRDSDLTIWKSENNSRTQ